VSVPDEFDFTIDVKPSIDLLREIRSKVAAIQDEVREQVKGPIRDHVLEDTRKSIAVYPPRTGLPFEFATERSRRWYIANRRAGTFLSQPLEVTPWERTLDLQDGWTVEVDPRSTRVNTVMAITNTATDELGRQYSQAVYGPDPVPGHADTGWPDGLEEKADAILEGVDLDLTSFLQETLEAFRV